MTNEIIYHGTRMSFYRLFAQDNFYVEIPKIQRDYAQGRPKEETVRTKFLTALSAYLAEGKPNRDLDFIYGNTNTDRDKHHAFIPLDGQQRLTTLFLLHWYLAHIAGKTEHMNGFLRDNTRSKFTYETRASSREFCNALVTEEFNLDWNNTSSVAKWIRNQGWFFTFWDNDPTVNSMLSMLDDIHIQFSGKNEYYDLLIDDENPVITFQFLNLDEFNLTDDLYIKMNSRGKPLTSFENFKAKFVGEIDLLFKDSSKTYIASWLKDEKVSTSKYFSFKIDTEWLGHFWNLSAKHPKKVDGFLMNFIRTILAAWYAGNGSINKASENKSHILQVLLGTRNIDEQIKQEDIDFFIYDKIGCITTDSVTELISAFDVLMNLEHDTIKAIPKYQFKVNEIQNKVVEGTLLNQDRLLFHAFIQYLIHHSAYLQSIGKWMRVVFNLVENTRVEFEQLEAGFEEINKLIQKGPDILTTLCQKDNRISGFYSQQVLEEIIKAHLILADSQWENLIIELEKDKFNKGQIGYLLEFSGIWGYFQDHGNCDWDDSHNDKYFKRLKDYGSKSSAVLPHLQTTSNGSNLWERAVLSKGDYLVPTTSNRWNLLNSTDNPRVYSWKRFLRLNPRGDKQFEVLAQKRPLVKQVFDDKRFDINYPWQSLATIIADGASDWSNYFIEEPELFRICTKGFIRYDSENEIRIFKKKQLNSYHYELYTYAFYSKFLNKEDLNLITDFYYEKGYGWDYPCFIYSNPWVWKEKSYQIRIYFSPEKEFELIFLKNKGKRQIEYFTDEIQVILKVLKFKFIEDENDDWKGFYWYTCDEKSLWEHLSKLSSNLKKLFN